MLRCYNTFELGKAKACFLLPFCEFSARYREEAERQARDGCSPLLWNFPEFRPAPKHSPHAQAPRALIHGPRDTALAPGRGRGPSSSGSVCEFQCVHSAALKGIQEYSSREAEDSCLDVPWWGSGCGRHGIEPLPS